VICTSDQGSHFSSPHPLHVLRDAQVHMSMERKGPALDTIFTERLWRTLNEEEVQVHDYASPKEARQQLKPSFEL
jgi:putative transposase